MHTQFMKKLEAIEAQMTRLEALLTTAIDAGVSGL